MVLFIYTRSKLFLSSSNSFSLEGDFIGPRNATNEEQSELREGLNQYNSFSDISKARDSFVILLSYVIKCI